MYLLSTSDAIDWLGSLEKESVDLIITDPPYESVEKQRVSTKTARLRKWFPPFPNERFDSFFSETYRVLKKDSHLYVFCDQETMFIIKPMGERAGFKFWKPIVWDKINMGMGYHYRASYELVLFFEKGKRKLNDLSVPDVLSSKRLCGKKFYPAEKPVDISEVLVTQSSAVGDLVCDPFMGSGSIGEAALRHQRRFIGCDLLDHAVDTTRSRLESIGS